MSIRDSAYIVHRLKQAAKSMWRVGLFVLHKPHEDWIIQSAADLIIYACDLIVTTRDFIQQNSAPLNLIPISSSHWPTEPWD